MFDPRGIVFILAAMSLLMAIVLFAMPVSIRERIGGARYWSWAMLTLSACSVLFGLRDVLPDLFSQTVANSFGLLSTAMIYAGARAFFGLPARHGSLAVTVLLASLSLVVCRYVVDWYSARVVIFALVSGGLLLLYGLEVVRHRPREYGRAAFPYLFSAVTVFFDVLISALRIVSTLVFPGSGDDFFAPTTINILYFATHSMLALCISVGFILMLNERLHAMLEHQLSHDSLTNAYARATVLDMAERALAGRQPVALLLLDLDHFKRVNDTLGHQVGDEVLKHVVSTLALNLRPDELLGRYGGEEFLLLLRGADAAQPARVAERLCQRVAETPYLEGEQALPITLSIGYASAVPGESLEQLLQRADAALYRAKHAGRNQVAAG